MSTKKPPAIAGGIPLLKDPRLRGDDINVARMTYCQLAQAANHVTSADCGTDNASHVRAHSVHQEEVLRVILGTFHLRNTCGHRHGGHASRTDKRVCCRQCLR